MARNRSVGWGMGALPRIARGEGSYLYDTAGRRYLDGSGGPAAFSIGHGNREVNAAIAAQLEQVACGYRYLFTSDPLEELTRLLLALSGPEFAHIVYSGSGSEGPAASNDRGTSLSINATQPQSAACLSLFAALG